jgi:hypothetical protein
MTLTTTTAWPIGRGTERLRRLMTSRCSDRSNDRMSLRGTAGTVGTMVPTCVGDRESRGPRDHARTIFYMSRATPEKRGGLLGPAHGRRGSTHPSPVGTMVLTVPMVPTGAEDLSQQRRPASCVWELSSSLSRRRCRDHLASTVPTRRRESQTFGGLSRRVVRTVGLDDPRLRELRFDQAAASTRCGRRGAIFQPVVCLAALPARSVPWFPSWLQASGSSASRRSLWAKPNARADRSGGNNCWRSSPVFSFCI